jgi:hypothetical protein
MFGNTDLAGNPSYTHFITKSCIHAYHTSSAHHVTYMHTSHIPTPTCDTQVEPLIGVDHTADLDGGPPLPVGDQAAGA